MFKIHLLYKKIGGLSVEFVSNYAYYIYEIKTLNSIFKTSAIKLSSSNALYFWGMSPTNA